MRTHVGFVAKRRAIMARPRSIPHAHHEAHAQGQDGVLPRRALLRRAVKQFEALNEEGAATPRRVTTSPGTSRPSAERNTPAAVRPYRARCVRAILACRRHQGAPRASAQERRRRFCVIRLNAISPVAALFFGEDCDLTAITAGYVSSWNLALAEMHAASLSVMEPNRPATNQVMPLPVGAAAVHDESRRERQCPTRGAQAMPAPAPH